MATIAILSELIPLGTNVQVKCYTYVSGFSALAYAGNCGWIDYDFYDFSAFWQSIFA